MKIQRELWYRVLSRNSIPILIKFLRFVKRRFMLALRRYSFARWARDEREISRKTILVPLAYRMLRWTFPAVSSPFSGGPPMRLPTLNFRFQVAAVEARRSWRDRLSSAREALKAATLKPVRSDKE